MESLEFRSPRKGILSLERLIDEILHFMGEQPKERYRLIIGTDSVGRGNVIFVTAVVIYRIGKGGRYFWRKFDKVNLYSLAQIIQEEVSLSLECAWIILKYLQQYLLPFNCNLEIHVDIGEGGPTKTLIKEIVGMVVGSGFVVQTKPNAFGASVVADKHLP